MIVRFISMSCRRLNWFGEKATLTQEQHDRPVQPSDLIKVLEVHDLVIFYCST